MASVESKLFYYILRLINKKKFLELQFTFGKFDFYDSKEPPREIKKVCDVSKHEVNGRAVFTLTPKKQTSGKHILYLHGGAYVQSFVKQHWKFLALLVDQTHCTITAPDYPLAPAYTYVDAFDMVIPLYKDILKKAGSSNVIVMGDSAGGGFALALAQQMHRDNVAAPNKIVLLSPWLDITLKNPEIDNIDSSDPFLSVTGLRKAGQAYAGKSDPSNFMLSPINGPIKHVGEISIFIGSKDILVADARKFTLLAEKTEVTVNYREYPDMVHVWMLLNFRESRQAQQEIIKIIIED
jgi:epsilon-lactone hydrolase